MNEQTKKFIHERGMEMDKKNELLAAAREVFAEKGYKAAGISDIAKRSQMAVGSFYKYYESKEAIFLEVYVTENSRIREGIMQSVDWQGEPEAIIEQLFAVTFELISRVHQAYPTVRIYPLSQPPPCCTELYSQQFPQPHRKDLL